MHPSLSPGCISRSTNIKSRIEIFQFSTLSSINELKVFLDNSSCKIISFMLIIVLLRLWFAFVAALIIFIFRDKSSNSLDKYEEFSVYLKLNRKAKLYTTIWLVKRIAFAIIVVSLSSVLTFSVILLMTIIQYLFYFVFIIIVKPFKEANYNSIESINEIVSDCWINHPLKLY